MQAVAVSRVSWGGEAQSPAETLMRDIALTGILAIALTAVAIPGLQLERRAGVIGLTFAMCVLLAGVIVRVVADWRSRR